MRLREEGADLPAARIDRTYCMWSQYTKGIAMVAAANRIKLARNLVGHRWHGRYYGIHMREALRAMPKAELHVHLEGSVEPETLAEIAPGVTVEEARERYRFTGFNGFLESYKWANRLLQTPQHYGLITERLLESLHRQGVVHAEINLSVGVVLWKEQDFRAIFDAVLTAAEGSPVETRWIFDAIRHFGPEHVRRVAEIAVENRLHRVVAFGIGGDELRGPAGQYQEIFNWVRSMGLAATPHAGETDGPASIWAALELGADRIGHGVTAIEDPVLVRHLRDHRIPLEMCITSNVKTGVVVSASSHPARKLYDAGVPVTLNTDDPAIFGTDLLNEYEIARADLGFGLADLQQIAKNSLTFRFG